MNEINVVMPMAGEGSRFAKVGLEMPKPLININGKPFFYWASQSVIKYCNVEKIIFVILERHVMEYGLDSVIRGYYPKSIIKTIPKVLPGAVYSAMEGVKEIDNDSPVIINDCDHMFFCPGLNLINNTLMGGEAGILSFKSDSPNYSYIKFDSNGKIVGTIEKKVVSNSAICGAYVFNNKKVFLQYAEKYNKNCPYNESYISGIYNELVEDGCTVYEFPLKWHVEFGTPEEYDEAKKSDYFKGID